MRIIHEVGVYLCEAFDDKVLRLCCLKRRASLASRGEAIYLAGENAGHDLITFGSSLSGTIELSIGESTIDSDLTIQGPGVSTVRRWVLLYRRNPRVEPLGL